MKFYYIAAVSAALTLSSCQDNTNQGTDVKTENNEKSANDNNSVSAAYLDMKDALYKSDAAKTASSAEAMKKELANYTPKDTTNWKAASASIQNELQAIASSKDIKEQRTHFEKVSDAMYDAASKYQLAGKTLYREFCPMAFDGKGAYWLSDKEEIENPYFGDEMPHCGSVEDTLEVK